MKIIFLKRGVNQGKLKHKAFYDKKLKAFYRKQVVRKFSFIKIFVKRFYCLSFVNLYFKKYLFSEAVESVCWYRSQANFPRKVFILSKRRYLKNIKGAEPLKVFYNEWAPTKHNKRLVLTDQKSPRKKPLKCSKFGSLRDRFFRFRVYNTAVSRANLVLLRRRQKENKKERKTIRPI